MLLVAGSLYYYWLALTPNVILRKRVEALLRDARGVEQVSRVLARHYKVEGVGSGNQWHWAPRPEASDTGQSVTVLIGKYRLLFVTSVEAMAVLDESGAVVAVEVRRTVDAL